MIENQNKEKKIFTNITDRINSQFPTALENFALSSETIWRRSNYKITETSRFPKKKIFLSVGKRSDSFVSEMFLDLEKQSCRDVSDEAFTKTLLKIRFSNLL